jgi:hypothetical protein
MHASGCPKKQLTLFDQQNETLSVTPAAQDAPVYASDVCPTASSAGSGDAAEQATPSALSAKATHAVASVEVTRLQVERFSLII